MKVTPSHNLCYTETEVNPDPTAPAEVSQNSWFDKKLKRLFTFHWRELAGFLLGLSFAGVILVLNLLGQEVRNKAYINSESNTSDYINLRPNVTEVTPEVLSVQSTPQFSLISPSSLIPPASSLTDLNTATSQELESLPGIGPVYAQRIIENRPYTSLEQILRVPGIGPKTFEKIKDRIKI